MFHNKVLLQLSVLLTAGIFTTASVADHAWSTYHWERSSNPIELELGDNVDSNWDGHLLSASTDWSVSTVLNTTVVPGSTSPRRCKAQTGNVQI